MLRIGEQAYSQGADAQKVGFHDGLARIIWHNFVFSKFSNQKVLIFNEFGIQVVAGAGMAVAVWSIFSNWLATLAAKSASMA